MHQFESRFGKREKGIHEFERVVEGNQGATFLRHCVNGSPVHLRGLLDEMGQGHNVHESIELVLASSMQDVV